MTSLPDYYNCEKRPFSQQFEKDVANHEMFVIKDDGLYRHLRFKNPDTMCMHFDILTWPGYLCYTGDMGTFVFRRLTDMFQFFRKSDNSPIDFAYWAQKAEAVDRIDDIREWCPEAFRTNVLEFISETYSGHTPESKESIISSIEREVLSNIYDLPKDCLLERLCEFSLVWDWEDLSSIVENSMVYSQRFLWCCHALVWGISCYDKRNGLTYQPSN